MKTLIIGASGSTGKQLVNQLLAANQQVKVVVRPSSKVPASWEQNEYITIIKGEVLNFSCVELSEILKDCQAVASCLGHNLTLKGIFGKPRKLVTQAVKSLSEAIEHTAPDKPIRFVLMNTAGNRNRDNKEPISLGERTVISLLRLMVPPHPDNEQAADHLRTKIGQKHPRIEWVAVRPDTLLNEETTSAYAVHPSPTRSAIFNPGKTSRINVAHFMAQLILDDGVWEKWKGQMPVIYNAS